MELTLKKATDYDYKIIKPLFLSAFPPEERQPYHYVKSRARKGKAQMLVARDKEEFIGFVYLVEYKDTVYLFLLAIDEKKRGQGYGSLVLSEIKKMLGGKRLFLAREVLDSNSENYNERLNRHAFYIKNGFVDYPLYIKEAGVTYEVMGIGGSITPSEYDELITFWCGKFIKGLIGMKLFEKIK